MTPLSYLLVLLGVHITRSSAGQCLSLCRDPDDCPPSPPAPGEPLQPGMPPSVWATCLNGPANGGPWACQASDIDFPTVACLVADMKTCGLVGEGGRSTVFYSFGSTTVQARTKFRNTLNPTGIMFNDALDENYWDNVLKNNENGFGLDQNERMTILVARFAEAIATVSTGQVYIVVAKFNGDGGGQGAYQLPTDTTNPNVWRAYEFPTLQRNPAITQIISVDLSNNANQHVDWQPNNNQEQLPASGASDLVVPPRPLPCPQPPNPPPRRAKRQAPPCVTCITFATPGGPTGTVSVSGTAPATAGITSAPTLSCTLQNEDPDQGINTDYCICSGSTLPVLPSASNPAGSCAYTTINAASTINPTPSLPVVTNNCQVCTVGIESEECTSLAGCTPTATAPPPTPPSPTAPAPVCVAGDYGLDDPTCSGKCNGPNAVCGCGITPAGVPDHTCTCYCGTTV